MTLLPGSKAAKIESLQAELAEAQTNLSLSEETRTGLEQSLAALQVEVESLSASLVTANAELEKVTADFESYRSGEESRAQSAARAIMASIGETPPVEDSGGEPNTPAQSLIAQYSALSGEAKTAFFEANKAGIYAEAEAIRSNK